jgi:hypothetical protein
VLTKFANEAGIATASVTPMGPCESTTVDWFDFQKKTYKSEITGQREILTNYCAGRHRHGIRARNIIGAPGVVVAAMEFCESRTIPPGAMRRNARVAFAAFKPFEDWQMPRKRISRPMETQLARDS